MTTNDHAAQQKGLDAPHKNKRLAAWLWALVLGILLGSCLYFGLPYLYLRLVQPVETNTSAIHLVETRQVQNQANLDERLAALEQRVNTLELQHSHDSETISQLQSEVSAAQADLDAQSLTLERLDQVEKDLQTFKTQIAGQQNQQDSLLSKEGSIAEIERDMQRVNALELLSRARQSLERSNLGQAGDDLAAARQIVANIYDQAPAYQQAVIQNWISRLDMVKANLINAPVLAGQDLDIAWQMMAANLPANPSLVTATPVATMTPQTTEVNETTATPVSTQMTNSPAPIPEMTPTASLH